MFETATDCLLPVVLCRHVLQILNSLPESLRHVALHSICSWILADQMQYACHQTACQCKTPEVASISS